METNTITKPPRYILSPNKLDKYIVKLLNGEAHKLETWLPNILTVNSGISGTMERETYDYRLGQYRKKEPQQYNTHVNSIIQKLEEMKKTKQEILSKLVTLKEATDQHHERSKTHI